MIPDDNTLEEFLRRLAKAMTYKSHPLGFEDCIDVYWKEEAIAWVEKLYPVDKPAGKG